MKIHEIAKELGVQSKDVLEKAKAMGVKVRDRMADLSEEDSLALKNALSHSIGGTETKIVRVQPKAKENEQKDEEVRVTRKANIKPPLRPTKPREKEDRPPRSGQGAPSGTAGGGKAAQRRSGSGHRQESPASGTGSALAPEGRPVPRRITRAELEAEEQAKKARVEGTEPSGETETTVPEKAPAKPAAKAVLKVAYSDRREAAKPAAAEQKEKPKEAATEAARDAVAAKPTASELPKKTELDASGATEKPETVDTERLGEAAHQTETQTGIPAGGDAAHPEKDASAARPSTAQGQGAVQGQGNRRPDKRDSRRSSSAKGGESRDSGKGAPAKTAGNAKDSHAAKAGQSPAPGVAGKTRDGAPKSKHPAAAKPKEGADKSKETPSKNKDKKGLKGKDTKGDSAADKARKRGVRDQRGRGGTEDFRGSRRGPILEDSSLEKRPVRSKPRPKPLPKAAAEPQINLDDLAPGTKIINVPITVAGFAEQIEKSSNEVIIALMRLGIMANINQNLDETTVQLLGDEIGIPIYVASDAGEIIEEGIEDFEDNPDDLHGRSPIITVMGHVDHGKTSLLDRIRETNVTAGEAGGITQHIGASEVTVNGQRIVFLDTPGHEAFTAMRARGAHVTDIAVLVVAADDGVMPQTVESISHAKAAGVPIIVAINKMDKEGANPDRVKQELSEHGILVEEWGGDTISVPVSAKTGDGVMNLLEMILLQAEVLELKANPNRLALGTVVEGRLDKSKGAVATLLVLNGTLESGMSVVAGLASGRIRVMTDFAGKPIRKAGPSTAVEITGLSEVPQAGDAFNAVRDDRLAREIAEGRRLKQREEIMARTSGASLETLFSRISENELKELNIIIKGDVHGSVDALTASLEKLSNENVKVRIIHTGVGTVNESDVMLAGTSDAVIIGFNVRPGSAVTAMAERDGVEIRTYRVIYDAIADVEAAMKGMLDPEFREVVLGSVEIRELFKVPGAGTIGGAYVLDGKILRNAEARIVRDGIVIHEGKISSLRRFKDDVREVATGYECGIGIENFNDIKVGDVIEAFTMEETPRE
jgi:translation initiation factor IF-2